MAITITCKACGNTMQVYTAEDMDRPSFTCPRCLAAMVNPALENPTQPPAVVVDPGSENGITAIPGGEKGITARPPAARPLHARRPASVATAASMLPPAQRDVNRDLKFIGCGLAVVAFLGVASTAVLLVWAGNLRFAPNEEAPWAALLIPGLVVVVVGGLIMFVQDERMHPSAAAELVVLGMLLTAGAVFVVLF